MPNSSITTIQIVSYIFIVYLITRNIVRKVQATISNILQPFVIIHVI